MTFDICLQIKSVVIKKIDFLYLSGGFAGLWRQEVLFIFVMYVVRLMYVRRP